MCPAKKIIMLRKYTLRDISGIKEWTKPLLYRQGAVVACLDGLQKPIYFMPQTAFTLPLRYEKDVPQGHFLGVSFLRTLILSRGKCY